MAHPRIDTFMLPNLNQDVSHQGHLRRQLQTGVCETTSSSSVKTIYCGAGPGGAGPGANNAPGGNNHGNGPNNMPNNNQQSSTSSTYCSGTYACSCGECHYCPALDTGLGVILCQVSGSTSTYTQSGYNDGLSNLCTCLVFENGTVTQNCGSQSNKTMSSSGFIQGPANIQPTASPTARMHNGKDLGMNSSAGNMNSSAGSTRAGGTNSSVGISVEPLMSQGCKATAPYNPRVCEGGPEYCSSTWIDCNEILPQYSCMCSDAPDRTMCNYCQIQTPKEILCQVSGSYSHVMGLDGVEKACSCEDAGNGQVISKCTDITR